MIIHGVGLRAINDSATFRGSWDGHCDACGANVLDSDLCWYWVGDFVSPILHAHCFDDWVRLLPPGVREALVDTVEQGRIDLDRGRISYPDLNSLVQLRAEAKAREDREWIRKLGVFADYVNDWSYAVSTPARRLTELYDSISIWEVYKRLLPDKPHRPFNPQGNTSCACPHETGNSSLSMSINDAKGVYFCFHDWRGNNKMALYCEIRGFDNRPALYHRLKRLMVWEFRGRDPYSAAHA